jgi:hypothetical protein
MEPPVVKLEESSDDELYRPTLPRFGDAGQGSSRQVPPPQDDDSSTFNLNLKSALGSPLETWASPSQNLHPSGAK